jgi:hypothetical protein
MIDHPPIHSDIAIIMHTCDDYERLWPGFAWCWLRYFPWIINAPRLYFVNEEKPMPDEFKAAAAIHLPTGPGAWSTRLLKALDQLPHSYILYMQEDFWLKNSGIYAGNIWVLANYLWVKKHQAIRIMGGGPRLLRTLESKRTREAFQRFKLTSPYFFGHAATLWDKEHFMRCLAPGENPWKNCANGTKRCLTMNPRPVHYHYPLVWYHAVHANAKHQQGWKVGDSKTAPGKLSPYGNEIEDQIRRYGFPPPKEYFHK